MRFFGVEQTSVPLPPKLYLYYFSRRAAGPENSTDIIINLLVLLGKRLPESWKWCFSGNRS